MTHTLEAIARSRSKDYKTGIPSRLLEKQTPQNVVFFVHCSQDELALAKDLLKSAVEKGLGWNFESSAHIINLSEDNSTNVMDNIANDTVLIALGETAFSKVPSKLSTKIIKTPDVNLILNDTSQKREFWNVLKTLK